jgi:hypothetical protein
MYPFKERWILARLFTIPDAARHNQRIETICYVVITVGGHHLDATQRPDRPRGSGEDLAVISWFIISAEPWQPGVGPVEDLVRSTKIKPIATRVDQEPDPAGPGDLSWRTVCEEVAHGTIFLPGRIRHKDKDPSFSAREHAGNHSTKHAFRGDAEFERLRRSMERREAQGDQPHGSRAIALPNEKIRS